ncbi:MAG: hypothetical protein ACI4NA_00655 [Succinivibrio sp.]
MERSFLALAAAAALTFAALPALAQSQGDQAQANDGSKASQDAGGTAAQGQAAKAGAKAGAAPGFAVPEVTLENCSDKNVLDKVIERLQQAEEKSDLDRPTLEAIKGFSEKCQAVLKNR